MAWRFEPGDTLQIANPTGVSVNAAFTLLAVVNIRTISGDGQTIVKVADMDGDAARGITLAHNGSGALRYRMGGSGATHSASLTVSADTWANVSAHKAGSGVSQAGVGLNGTRSTENLDAPSALTTGDGIAIGYGEGGPGWGQPTIEVAMLAWLQGIYLTGAEADAYADDPVSLYADYGPSGAVTADALKLLLLGDLDADLSGVGNHPTISGGETVSGPDGYPTGLTEPTAALTGTATEGITESDIVAGGKTIIATLEGVQLVAATVNPAFSTATAATTTAAPGRTGDGALSIAYPASYTPTAGHLAIIVLYHDQGTGTTPDGWTQVSGSPFGSGTQKLQVFWRKLAGSDATPSTTISGSTTGAAHCAGMLIYSAGKIGNIGSGNQGTGTPMTATELTTSQANAIVVALFGRGDNETSSGQQFGGSGTGVTERLDAGTDQGNDAQVSAADKSFPDASTATGSATATTSATDPWVAAQVEIIPDTPFADARQAAINGIDGDLSTGTSWDAVRSSIPVSALVRTSDTVMTLTLPALGSYDITETETLEWTIPSDVLVSGGPIVATPTIEIEAGEEDVTIEAPTAVTAVTAYAPAISAGATVAPPLATTAVVAYAPAVSAGATVAPPLAQTEVIAYAPEIFTTPVTSVAVPTALSEVRAYAPTVSTGATVAVPLAQSEVIAYAPTIIAHESVAAQVPTALSQVVAYAPTILAFDHVTVAVPLARTTMRAYAPTILAGFTWALRVRVGETVLDVPVHPDGHSLTTTGRVTSERGYDQRLAKLDAMRYRETAIRGAWITRAEAAPVITILRHPGTVQASGYLVDGVADVLVRNLRVRQNRVTDYVAVDFTMLANP